MATRTASLLLLFPGLLLAPPAQVATDWPGWRGPDRTGVSAEKGLLPAWPKEGPKLLWTATGLGRGYAAPAVVGRRLFILGTKGDDEEYVRALSVEDGKELWATRVGKVGENSGPSYPGP